MSYLYMSNFPRETPQSFFQKTRFLQNGMVDQKKNLTKCLRLLQKCPWNGTWVKPFHSGNIQRDAKGPKQSGISHSALLNYQREPTLHGLQTHQVRLGGKWGNSKVTRPIDQSL